MHSALTRSASERAAARRSFTHCGVWRLAGWRSLPASLNAAPRAARIVRAIRLVGRAVAHRSRGPNGNGNCSAMALGNLRKLVAIMAGLPFVDTFSNASSLPSQGEGRGGVGSRHDKKNPAAAGTPKKRHPRYAPRARLGITGVASGCRRRPDFSNAATAQSTWRDTKDQRDDWRDRCGGRGVNAINQRVSIPRMCSRCAVNTYAMSPRKSDRVARSFSHFITSAPQGKR